MPTEAKIIGMAAIQNWKLVFRTHATIEPAAGRVVPVLIWEITDRDEKNLDLYEGFPSYYFKQDMTVTMTDLDGKNPQEITAMVYLMEEGHDIRVPYRGYLDTLAEGYRRFGCAGNIRSAVASCWMRWMIPTRRSPSAHRRPARV